MSRFVPIMCCAGVVLSVAFVVAWAASFEPRPVAAALPPEESDDVQAVVDQIDRLIEADWVAADVAPAQPADEMLVLRRLSLALCGTIPSLEELRAFESDERADRLTRWTARLLDDQRFADYFAERLARACVGVDGGQFIVYRRDRFVRWLSEQLASRRPYDEIVRDILAANGLWTGEPATNFVTAALAEGDINESRLAGKTVRAFLGQRIDCAQCHDHPFADWKQEHFEGLAAFFGQTQVSVAGVEDVSRRRGEPVEYVIEDGESQNQRAVQPGVPFAADRLPADGTRRQQLAAWVTHPENRRFHRAAVNRVWALVFGRPLTWPDHAVDDVPEPDDGGAHPALDVLADDFRRNGCDLRRLILVITSSRPFRLSSQHGEVDESAFQELEQAWAVFPLTRLRPEQVIGSMLQATSIHTIDQNSHLLTRTIRFFREQAFVNQYGDLGDAELDEQAGTIPQALLRMNGNLARELTSPNFLNAAGRINAVASDPETCVETAYLVCLSRRPTPEEQSQFASQLANVKNERRGAVVQDLFWTLFNVAEFSWNH